MFPESFVETALAQYTEVGDLVLDPFSGRGTTLLQALFMERSAAPQTSIPSLTASQRPRPKCQARRASSPSLRRSGLERTSSGLGHPKPYRNISA